MNAGLERGRNPSRHEKSLCVTYILWLFAGIFGTHHFYLGRVRHGFVWWTTLGGFGFGWIGEALKIRRYVLDANEDPAYLTELYIKMRRTSKPPFSINRCMGMILVGYCWALVTACAIPTDSVFGINLRSLIVIVPLVAAVGVWTVGNIGRQRGTLKWPVLAAYLSFPIRYYIYEDSTWLLVMCFISAMAFDIFSKNWDPRLNRRSMPKVVTVVAICSFVYIVLLGSCVYHNVDWSEFGDGDISFYDAIFTVPWWSEIKNTIFETYTFVNHHGWSEIWKQLIEMSNPFDEQNAYEVIEAYEVLGLGPDSTQQEITSAWRQLSRENHPDKVKDPSQRRAAQDRFMEIQQAYELLSRNKNRRSRRNKRDNTIPDSVPVSF